ncbi:MAG: DUF3794 domain-containing protein [Eubacteriales bacterium]|nr:DUF3794 domain-containing protein [Eubacteriales bacterium]
MNLNKEIIHETRIKCSNTIQITLDDDYNVPDSKADIDSIIKEYGIVVHDDVKASKERAQVSGQLKFALLYIGARQTDGRHMPVKMTGEMPFSESINMSDVVDGGNCTCRAVIDDLTIKEINSRKISVRAIISLTVTCEEMQDIMAAVEVEQAGQGDNADSLSRNYPMVQVLTAPLSYTQVALKIRDNLRIRSTVALPSDRPQIGEIIWEDIDVRNMNTRLTDSGVTITGELSIFLMYTPLDESMPVQWYDTVDTFEENLDVNGCSSELIGYIRHSPISTNVEVKPDYDGENRDISVELVMNMDIKAYEECEKNLIEDIYSPVCRLSLQRSDETLYQLLIHNNSKCRASGQQPMNAHGGVLQICNCTGTVQVDSMEVTKEGIIVDGAILANVFYVSDDDRSPMGSMKAAIPFSEKIMVKLTKEQLPDVVYHVITGLDQLAAVMVGGGQIEIKGIVSVDILCFVKNVVSVIGDCEISDEIGQIEAPAMIGYFSDGKSRMWDIAKKYHTTTELIRSMNPAVTEQLTDASYVKRGEKLLLVRAARK